VLAANLTGFLVALGFYPLASLVVRYVETPASAGYGFGAPVLAAGLMLTPFSLASFAASKIARRLAERTSSEAVVAGSCVVLIASMVMFLLARGAYWEIAVAMAIDGFGVGCVFAVNPLQITRNVPAGETGSAISFYQLMRTVAYSLGSALSATVLVLSTPRHQIIPANQGYSNTAMASTAVLAAALVSSALFAVVGPVRLSPGVERFLHHVPGNARRASSSAPTGSFSSQYSGGARALGSLYAAIQSRSSPCRDYTLCPSRRGGSPI
jgi:MFS family permease